MLVYETTIPITPVAKGRPRTSRHGHMYTPAKTREFENKLKAWVESDLIERCLPMMTCPLAVVLEFRLKRPKTSKLKFHPAKRPDIDNYIKAVFDALNDVLWKDDSQVVWLHTVKLWDDSDSIYIHAKAY